MIDHVETAFALRSAGQGDDQPVFAGVQAQGRLDGVLFALTLRQTYRNAGTRNMEVVYTFPLPPGAVLLGFAAELDGKRLDGRILPHRQAERDYEEALAEGDAPVLLEMAEGGLHTANIGNLLPGETVVLEIRFAQLLSFDQGRLRLAIPTTIAPRYGSAEQGGLLPHQGPLASVSVDYPLSLSVVVSGSLANAAIDCPTHAHRLMPARDGLTLALAPGARLDRDVVFIVTPREPNPNLLINAPDEIGARDGIGLVMLAAFETPLAPTRACTRPTSATSSPAMNWYSRSGSPRCWPSTRGGCAWRSRLRSRLATETPRMPACSPSRCHRHRCWRSTPWRFQWSSRAVWPAAASIARRTASR